MKYLLLLANAPDAWGEDAAGPADWLAYTQALQEAGVLVGGAGLHSPDAATTVQVRNGSRILIDGPFADTKEHLIGYYLIDVPHLDVALDWAARVPNVRTGSVEVRPISAGSETDIMLATGKTPEPA